MKLNKKVSITIGREYGSGGRAIAMELGEALQIPVFDKNMISIAAKESGLSEQYLESGDEHLSNPFFEPYVMYGMEKVSPGDKVFDLQSKIIREKAEEGSAIFVGRCSDEILKRNDDVFHFYIFAPRLDRIKRIMEVEQIAESPAADKILKKVDKQRKSYYQFYTDKKWGSPEGKDLLINSSTLGISGTVQMILEFLKLKGYVSG